MTASYAPSSIDWYFRGHGDALVDSAVESLGQPTPPLMAIMAEPDTISVLPSLDEAFLSLPPPWTHVPELDAWACDTAALSATAVPPRWPVLLPLGVARGAVLLVNLEQVSPLTITGDVPDVAAVLRGWVMHLLLTPQRVIATTVDAITPLGQVGSERFVTAINPLQLRQTLQSQQLAPDVVILDDKASPKASAEAFGSSPCLITTAPAAGNWAFHVDGHTATLANDGRQLAVAVDSVTALDERRWRDILDTLRTDSRARTTAPTPPAAANGHPPAPQRTAANAPESPPWAPDPQTTTPSWAPEATASEPAPAEPAPADTTDAAAPATESAETAEPHIWVRVLGEPTVTPPDGRTIDNPGRKMVWTSVIAYLATIARDGATREELRDCWPATTPVNDESIRQTLSRIRTFLGNGPDGQPLLSEFVRGGRRGDSDPAQKVRLHPSVLADWVRWQQLLGDDPHQASDTALATALAYVRAPAFSVPANAAERFAWSKFLVDEITDAVPDAARILAARHQDRNDAPAAAAAALAGLKANPQRQDLWRLALTATSDTMQRASLVDQLRQTIPAADIEPATRKLIS